MTTEDVPEAVALVRAGWRYRRMARLQEDLRDAEKTRAAEHAAIDERYDRYQRARQDEYDQLRAGFATVLEKITSGAALLPDEIQLAGEWLAEIPPPFEPPLDHDND